MNNNIILQSKVKIPQKPLIFLIDIIVSFELQAHSIEIMKYYIDTILLIYTIKIK